MTKRIPVVLKLLGGLFVDLRLRFSLRSLILLVMLVGSVGGLWWRWEAWPCIAVLKGHFYTPWLIEISPNDKKILTFDSGEGFQARSSPARDCVTRVWDAQTFEGSCEIRWAPPPGSDDMVFPELTGGGDWVIISQSLEWTQRIYDAGTGLDAFASDSASIFRNIVPISGGDRFLVVEADRCFLWDPARSERGKEIEIPGVGKNMFRVFPDGRRILTINRLDQAKPDQKARWDDVIRVWDTVTGQVLRELGPHTPPIETVELSEDGRHVLVRGGDRLTVWDLQGGDAPLMIDGCLPEGRLLLVGEHCVLLETENGDLHLWDMAAKQRVAVLAGPIGPKIVMSPDGRNAATYLPEKRVDNFKKYPGGQEDLSVVIWETRTGRKVCKLPMYAYLGEVQSMEFSRGSEMIKVETIYAVRIFDVARARLILHEIGEAEFIPGQGRAVIYDREGYVCVWSTESGEALQTLTGHRGAVKNVAVFHDGEQIVTLGEDKTIRIWSRRRPDLWWGIFWLWETWAVMVFGIGLACSVYGDRGRLWQRGGAGD